MLSKKQVMDAIEQMPETFDATDLFDRILLLKKIEQGREDIRAGRSYTTEQAEDKLAKWLK